MALMEVGLDDKYRLDAKRIFLSGTQALVRLPMLQRERDRAAGLNTAGFISGYRGSPLGMYDHALWRAKSFLKQHDIEFVGLNEDLLRPPCKQPAGRHVPRRQGRWRVGIRRQGPRCRRSAGALNANLAGTSPNGGVIALAGDDHGCQSSTLAHQASRYLPQPDAGGQSGDAAGLSRPRHSGLCVVALLKLLGRLQGDFRNR
jgi:indolepyruvate ferredoxin oxidoreductase